MEKIIIAAVSKNRVIGRNGIIPWHIKEELKHFKNTTTGFPVLMGRTTWESLNKPLENRINIILTTNPDFSFSHPNVVICNSIFDALSWCEENNYSKVFIIGGEQVFEDTLKVADRMIISELKFDVEGDRFFPQIDLNEWELVSSSDKSEFVIKEYLRRK
ncbi:MAG: dihydrofolate reductase [Melioribacter sp.]|nr:dihydrofolate reductase [Melioribacter sp.]